MSGGAVVSPPDKPSHTLAELGIDKKRNVKAAMIDEQDEQSPLPPRTTLPPAPAEVNGETGPAGQPSTRASVPFMVTAAMKIQLRDLGYTDAQIRDMRPADAHETIAAGRKNPSTTKPATITEPALTNPTPPKRLSLSDLKAAAISRRTQVKT